MTDFSIVKVSTKLFRINSLLIIFFLFLVKRLMATHGKPDIVKIVSECQLVLVSYHGFLLVELIRLDGEGEDRDYLDLNRSGPETGSVCDIVIRKNVFINGLPYSRVVMVAINTEPLDNIHFHVGKTVVSVVTKIENNRITIRRNSDALRDVQQWQTPLDSTLEKGVLPRPHHLPELSRARQVLQPMHPEERFDGLNFPVRGGYSGRVRGFCCVGCCGCWNQTSPS